MATIVVPFGISPHPATPKKAPKKAGTETAEALNVMKAREKMVRFHADGDYVL